jgi:hypothetical protein
VLGIIGIVVAIPTFSFVRAVTRSNGDPFSVKATEWARDHYLNWLVNRTEQYWYSHHQPPVGGVPKGGLPVVRHAPAPRRALPSCPRRVLPLAASPLPGEGAWQAAGRVNSGVCFAYMRPDAIHTSVVIGLAWMNMHMLRASLHNGTALPGGGPWASGPEIAPASYPRVVAAFNSGFRLDASRGGYFTEGHLVKPLVNGRASLVIYADGHVDVGMWGRDDHAGAAVASVRQNLDLLVDGGQLVSGLDDANSGRWGATLGNRIYTWRSGVGIDRNGNLVYAGGPGLKVLTLATVLQRAGAIRAMELDINPEWVSFMVYTGATPADIQATKLLASIERPADRYLHPGTRDFIELDLRAQPVGAWVGVVPPGNKRSNPSGVFNRFAAVPGRSVTPYCQTIAPVDGSMSATRCR